jgi:gamma-glutamyl:cysteine ligase YbdK (ATP-grasp superfamily)
MAGGAAMGQDLDNTTFDRHDRRAHREKLHTCLEVFAQMLGQSRFEFTEAMMGLEIELNLIDDRQEPAMRNSEVLNAIANDEFQTELGQFNIEINVPPRSLIGSAASRLETELRASLNDAEARARSAGAHIAMIGMLPTLRPDHLTGAALSANPRYRLLNEQVFAARGEDLHIAIDGPERLDVLADTIAPEAACTSVQFHLQVRPEDYAATWNAAQCIAGIQLALGANSPYLFGKELWRETRIALFQQATDTRPQELKEQGVRPRVWFGERWITSVFDQFEENVRYFPALLPVCDAEDPVAALSAGNTPALSELRMHNGTVYRWNRPVYDVVANRPHLRVENRVLPAGPTVVDILANGAFYYGLLRALTAQDRPLWSQMSFAAAADNFDAGARRGIDAVVYWPAVGEAPAAELVLRRLLPLARAGLADWGVDTAVGDHLLDIIEQRCITHQNGAEWQARMVRRIDERRQPLDRRESLRAMLERYVEHMHSNAPVHSWPLD